MKSLLKTFLPIILWFNAFPTAADSPEMVSGSQTATNTQNLVQYLQNLGSYFGYDITKAPGGTIYSYLLTDPTKIQEALSGAVFTYLSSIPVTTSSNASETISSFFFPSANTSLKGNISFSNYSGSGAVSVNPLIDQKSYQNDPVSQGILNILSTPDSSFCIIYDVDTKAPKSWNQNCPYLADTMVSANVIGNDMPAPTAPPNDFPFTYNTVQPFLSQLNSNSLTAPLLYSTQSNKSSTSSPSAQATSGLTAENQAQEAANFIRYVSGAVIPLSLPKQKELMDLYSSAYSKSDSQSPADILAQKEAQGVISKYLAGLRTYAALNSVGLSNLYYIMARRLPQNSTDDNKNTTSQALNEFNMATRRFDPTGQADPKWINKLNEASPATVQKEIAMLLAEINYQMYLDRQMQERLLLTNSALLLINAHTVEPQALSNSTEDTTK